MLAPVNRSRDGRGEIANLRGGGGGGFGRGGGPGGGPGGCQKRKKPRAG